MPIPWHQKDWQTILYWIETILEEASDSLNDWETKFIEQMHIRAINKWPLTQAQEEALERIYAEKTA